MPELTDKIILERLNKIQRINQIEPSAKLERSESCKYNLTIEMETGVGKTYTYIKTMYELNKHYGGASSLWLCRASPSVRASINPFR